MKRDIPLTTIVSVLLMFAIVPSVASSFSGQNAPDFHLADLSNAQHSLSELKGRIVVVDVFSVECSDCQISAKNVLVPLYSNYSSENAKVQFLSIETSGASADTIRTYISSTGITWPVLVGDKDFNNFYSTNGASTVYLIDPAGKIVVTMAHPLNIETLKASIDNLLGDSASATSPTTPDTNTCSTTTTNPSAVQPATPIPSTSPTPTPTPSEAPLNSTTATNPSTVQAATIIPSTSPTPTPTPSETATSSSSAPRTLVASTSTTSDTQQGYGDFIMVEKSSTPLLLQASFSTTSQKCLLYSPSLLTPIVSSAVSAQAAAMSAEAAALSQGSATSIPTIALPAQTNCAASLPVQSVFEFSLIGLGAPTLLVGVLYLLLRRV